MDEKILDMLAEICDDDIVKSEMEIDLFESGLLDSIGFTTMLVEIEDRFGVEISPTEIERSDMNTPKKIIEQINSRVGK